MKAFHYQALPMRVRFGAGAMGGLATEVADLGLNRVLVICTPGQRHLADLVRGLLDGRGVGVFDEARMHVPVDIVTRARNQASLFDADGCVVLGGGSSIGLGKAVALEEGLSIVALPTTYSGSEMTPVWGMTRDGRKETGKDPKVLPRSVIYDPELTLALPVPISVVSGINAVAHAVEALYAPDGSPITSLMAEEGVRSVVVSLPQIVAHPEDIEARSAALYGAWLCGACLGATTMSLHHKLCHVLGGSLDLPHAQTHAVLLPYTLAYNEQYAPAARTALQRALQTDGNPSSALWELGRRLAVPRSLAELGMRDSDIAGLVTQVLSNPYANPRPVTESGLSRLLEAAVAGAPPGSLPR